MKQKCLRNTALGLNLAWVSLWKKQQIDQLQWKTTFLRASRHGTMRFTAVYGL